MVVSYYALNNRFHSNFTHFLHIALCPVPLFNREFQAAFTIFSLQLLVISSLISRSLGTLGASWSVILQHDFPSGFDGLS